MTLHDRLKFWIALNSYVEMIVGPAQAPLLLPDAIADSLSYVKAFGGTEQGVPDGYTLVDFIMSDTNSYIETDISANDSDELDFYWHTDRTGTVYAFSQGRPASYVAFQLSNTAAATPPGVVFAIETSIDNHAVPTGVSANTNAMLHIQIINKEIFIDGVSYGTSTGTLTAPTEKLRLFCSSSGVANVSYMGRFTVKGKIDLFPCTRDSDGAVGFYDAISGTFLTNAGTGTLTAGLPAIAIKVTPDNPVQIISNNGKLVFRDTELPVGYRRLKDIIFDGETYYVTNTYLTGADTTTFTMNATETGRNVLGCYTGSGTGNNLSFYLNTGSLGNYIRYKDSLYRPVLADDKLNTDLTLSIGPTGTTGFDTDSTWTELEFTCPNNFYIGWLANASSPKFKGLFKGNVTISNRATLIPCERTSDGAIGYYNINDNVFFENQGTGTPTTSGYDYTHNTVVADGTVETVAFNLIEETHKNWGIDSSGVVVGTNNVWGQIAKVEPNKKYYYKQINSNVVVGFFASKPELGSVTYDQSRTLTNLGYFTTPNDNSIKYVLLITEQDSYIYDQSATAEMLLKVGDYQDVQEIISGAVTRNVGVMALDGTEGWQLATATDLVQFYTSSTQGVIANNVSLTSTIAPYGCTVANRTQYDFGCYSGNSGNLCFQMKGSATLRTVPAWTQYLADQYNAGTPVTIIYPLAQAVTEQVAPQVLNVQTGDNILEITQASLSNLELEAEYKKQA